MARVGLFVAAGTDEILAAGTYLIPAAGTNLIPTAGTYLIPAAGTFKIMFSFCCSSTVVRGRLKLLARIGLQHYTCLILAAEQVLAWL